MTYWMKANVFLEDEMQNKMLWVFDTFVYIIYIEYVRIWN